MTRANEILPHRLPAPLLGLAGNNARSIKNASAAFLPGRVSTRNAQTRMQTAAAGSIVASRAVRGIRASKAGAGTE
jgi:hypothetical protein